MTTKRTTKKALTSVGALRRLTDREIDAHKSMGGIWGEGVVPREKTLETLAAHGIEGDQAELIIDGSWDHLGRFGMEANVIIKRLAPREIVDQALMTAEIAKELERRLTYMEPNIKGLATGKALSTWGGRIVSDQFQTDLARIRALMKWVAADVGARARKTVTKRTGPRNRLLTEIASVIEQACRPTTKDKAREVAADLLRCWGVQTPAAERKVRSVIARTK